MSRLSQIKNIRNHLGPIWWHSALMLCAGRIGDVITMVIALFIVPATLNPDLIGAIPALNSIAGLVILPFTILVVGTVKHLNLYSHRGEDGKAKALLLTIARFAAGYSVVTLVVYFLFRDFLMDRLKLDNPLLIGALATWSIVMIWLNICEYASRSFKSFYPLIVSKIVGPVVRLIAILFLLKQFQLTGFLAAAIIGHLAVELLMFRYIYRFIRPGIQVESYRSDLEDIIRYNVPLAIWMGLRTLQLSIEPFVIRHRLPLEDSAGYYVVNIFGSIPLLVAPAIFAFAAPILSERFEKGLSTRKIHLQILACFLVIGVPLCIFYVFFGQGILSLTDRWESFRDYAPHMWKCALISMLTALNTGHMMHQNACRNFKYVRYFATITVTELLFIYGIWAYTVVPWLPGSITTWLDTLLSDRLSFLLWAMIFSRVFVSLFVIRDVIKYPGARGLEAASSD